MKPIGKPNGEVTKYVRFEHAGAVSYGIWEDEVVREFKGNTAHAGRDQVRWVTERLAANRARSGGRFLRTREMIGSSSP